MPLSPFSFSFMSFGLGFAFLCIWNHWKNDLFFTIWVIFWNISKIYFSLLTYKRLRAIVTLFCSNLFQFSFSDREFIPFQLWLLIKSLIFVILCGSFFYFFIIWCNYYSVLKAFIIFFIDNIYCCFFVFYPIRRIYAWSTTI